MSVKGLLITLCRKERQLVVLSVTQRTKVYISNNFTSSWTWKKWTRSSSCCREGRDLMAAWPLSMVSFRRASFKMFVTEDIQIEQIMSNYLMKKYKDFYLVFKSNRTETRPNMVKKVFNKQRCCHSPKTVIAQ